MGEWFARVFTGAVAIFILIMILLSGTTPIHDKKWTCSAQVIVNDTLPSEYECIQYTIKDKEIKKLTQGVGV